jgi:hypothetical protein
MTATEKWMMLESTIAQDWTDSQDKHVILWLIYNYNMIICL